MDKLHAAYRKQTVRHIPKVSGRRTRDSASWLVSRASLILVSCCTIKTDVLAESVSCWLAAGCTIAQASIHLLAFNVQAACIQRICKNPRDNCTLLSYWDAICKLDHLSTTTCDA